MSKRLFYILAILFGAVLVATISVIVTLMITQTPDNDTISDVFTIESDIKDIGDYSRPEQSRQDSFDYVTVNGSEKLRVKNNLVSASPLLCNYNNNFLIRITIMSGDKQLYRSGLIPSGKGVSDIKLSETFPDGEYDVKIIYEFFRNINETVPSKVEVEAKLVITD